MSFHLLDINVLIAAADPGHEFHAAFMAWYGGRGQPPLATCPLTENGFLRIYGRPDYPGGPGTLARALPPLLALRRRPGSRFLPDSLSIADPAAGIRLHSATPKQLTDLYLLALARRHGGKFATFDTRIQVEAVTGGAEAIEVIPV